MVGRPINAVRRDKIEAFALPATLARRKTRSPCLSATNGLTEIETRRIYRRISVIAPDSDRTDGVHLEIAIDQYRLADIFSDTKTC